MIPGAGGLDKIITDIYENVFKRGVGALAAKAKTLEALRRSRESYLDSLREQHGWIRILGMPSPIALDRLFVAVRVNREVQSRHYVEEQYFEYMNRGTQVPAAIKKELERITQRGEPGGPELIEQLGHSIVLGGPGSGKTTFLRYLAILYAGVTQRGHATGAARLPVFVSLRELADHPASLRKLLLSSLSGASFPEAESVLEYLLASGRAIILLDGFDEIPASRQSELVKGIAELAAGSPKSIVVVSSRLSEPLSELASFTELEMCEFRDDQVSEFIKKWFETVSPAKGRRLLKRVASDLHLKELASTPLLASLICILYKHDLSIPQNRGELYSRCLDCLLRDWDASRGFRRETQYEKLSDERKLQMLAETAHSLFTSGRLFFSPGIYRGLLERYLPRLGIPASEARGVLGEILSHHGIIVHRARAVLSFLHLTLQEYLTARHIVARGLQMDVARNLTRNPGWQEVITLTASILGDATDFVGEVLRSLSLEARRKLAPRLALGYGYMLCRSLVLSRAALSEGMRNALYSTFAQEHRLGHPVPWRYTRMEWRYSPRAGCTLVKAAVPIPQRYLERLEKLSIGSVFRSIRATLDLLVFSDPFRSFCEANVGMLVGEEEDIPAARQLLALGEYISKHGGLYEIRLG